MRRQVAAIRREHLEAFLVGLQDTGRSPATVNNRYRSLQAFFRWLGEEGELTESRMARMPRPKVPLIPIAVPREDDLSSACAFYRDGPGACHAARRHRWLAKACA